MSKVTELKPYVLRYWEGEFDILNPQKNRAGNRIYKKSDIQLLHFIKYLLYEKKYTIQGARELIEKYHDEKRLSELLKNYKTVLDKEKPSTLSREEQISNTIHKLKEKIQDIINTLD